MLCRQTIISKSYIRTYIVGRQAADVGFCYGLLRLNQNCRSLYIYFLSPTWVKEGGEIIFKSFSAGPKTTSQVQKQSPKTINNLVRPKTISAGSKTMSQGQKRSRHGQKDLARPTLISQGQKRSRQGLCVFKLALKGIRATILHRNNCSNRVFCQLLPTIPLINHQ